jgi:predicted ATP-dependent endonuclease of OLD family
MDVLAFKGTRIHGYLDFDLNFQKDLTFLTGINGSGKTTVIQSLIALLSPSLFVLANLEFEEITVELRHDQKKQTITASKGDGLVLLTTSGATDAFVINPFVFDPEDPSFRTMDGAANYRLLEKEAEYYREMSVRFAKHEVLQTIEKLPTPMFLDLDRRARTLQEGRGVRTRPPGPPARRGRNIFSFFLSQSLSAAVYLAETQYRATSTAVNRLGEELREQFVLDSLELDVSQGFRPLELPTARELETLSNVRQSVDSLPSILQIPKVQIEGKLLPNLTLLEKYAADIPKNAQLSDILQGGKKTQTGQQLQALVAWSASRPQLHKLVKMVQRVKDYNVRRQTTTSRLDRYVSIVNGFLKDSRKNIFFDEDGYLNFRLDQVPNSSLPVTSLSSGEAQLVVIITHLFFNPYAQEGNVFIIDEPELSLHVQWQELFVSSVMTANPDVQYIMATHSPSIILDRINRCVDLGRRDARG